MTNTKLEKFFGRNSLTSKPKIITAIVIIGFLLYEVGYSIGRLLFNLIH
jgi:hypothetical protein